MTSSTFAPPTRTQVLLWYVLATPLLVLSGALYAYVFLAKSYAWALIAALFPAAVTYAITRLLRIVQEHFAFTTGLFSASLVLILGYAGAWHINETNAVWHVKQHEPLTLPAPLSTIELRHRIIGDYFISPHAHGDILDHIVAIANHGHLAGTMPDGWPPLPFADHPHRLGAAAWMVWLYHIGVYALLIVASIRSAIALNTPPTPTPRGSFLQLEQVFNEHGVTHALTPYVAPLKPWQVVQSFVSGWHSFWKVIAAMVAFAALYRGSWEAFVLWLLFAGALFRASFFVFHPRETSTQGTPLDRLLNQLAQQVRVGVLLLGTLGLMLWVYRRVDVQMLAPFDFTPQAGFAMAALVLPWLLARLWPAYLMPLIYRNQGVADLWSHPADSKDTPNTSALAALTMKLAWQLTATPGAFWRATLPVAVAILSFFTVIVQTDRVLDQLPGMNTFASLFTAIFALPFLHLLIYERALALRNACPQATASAIRATGVYFANDPYAPVLRASPLSWLSAVFLPLRLWPARWRQSDRGLHHAHLRAHHDLERGARRRAAGDPARLLHEAARIGNPRLIEKALRRGAAINSHDDHGRPPLVNALLMRKLPVVRLLLERGADPNLGDQTGRPPLFYALETQDATIVAQLLRHGANPAQRDAELNTCWHGAVRLGKVTLCELLTVVQPLINAANRNGHTPIQLVCEENDDVVMLEWMVKHGADLSLPVPPDNASLAAVAARLNRPGVLRLIADQGHPIDAIDGTQRTPLLHAVTHESSAAVAMLLHLGADPHTTTLTGSAIEVAEQQLADRHTATRETILDMLREHVATA